MGFHIDETEAKTALETLLNNFTDDFKVIQSKRKPISKALYGVIFGVRVPPEKSESVYRSFFELTQNDQDIELLGSQLVTEEKKSFEIIFVQYKIALGG